MMAAIRDTHRQTVTVADLSYERIAPLDIIGLLRVLWYGKWAIGAVTAICVLCAGYYAFRMTSPQFAATATLQLDAKPAHLRDVSRQWPTPATDPASLNTQVRMLTSDPVLRAVIADLDLMADPEFNRYLHPASPFARNSIRARLRQVMTGSTDPVPDPDAMTQKTIANLRGRLSASRPNDTFLFHVTARSSNADKAASIANSVARASIAAQIAARTYAADEAIGWLTQRVAALQTQLVQQETAVTTLISNVQIQEETALDTLSTAVLAIDQERETAAASLAMYAQNTPVSARESAEMSQLSEQITRIDARRGRLQAQLAAQSAGMVNLQQMQREADTTRVLYQSFLARLQETQVQRGMVYADSLLITPAMTGAYVGPQKVLILLAAGLLGASAGVTLVAVRHMMRRGFDTPHGLQRRTGRPVYGQIAERWTRRETTAFRKQMRKLQAGLMLDAQHGPPQVTLVTSSVQNEASMQVAFGLAAALGVPDRPALLVHGGDKHARRLVGLAPCGLVTCIAMPAIGVADYAATVDAWRVKYGHVVILAPPVLTDLETRLMAQTADAIIYAVRWGKTAQTTVADGLQLIMHAGNAPIGLVLTRVNRRKMRRFAAIHGDTIPAAAMA